VLSSRAVAGQYSSGLLDLVFFPWACGAGASGLLPRVSPAGAVRFEDQPHLIADVAENLQLLLFGSFCFGWIEKAPMIPVDLTGKNRAGPLGIAADGDYRLDLVVEELSHGLRAMSRDIDTDLLHHLDGHRMHISERLGPRALHV